MSGDDNNDANGDDWRASVAQSRRTAEVRVVAEMLAKMEPGATASSKLMLAMRFEDDIFNKASSLADYQKRIQKRLKKFAKNYKISAAPVLPATSGHQEERLLELKRKYGDKLKYIVDNADKAIEIINQKNEQDKARSLKQHTDNVVVWATNLGVLEGTKPNAAMTKEAIDEMQSLMERRVDNIRCHVMKLADMDLLIQETLEKLEHDLSETTSNLLAAATSRRLSRLQWTDFDDPLKALQQSLEKAQATIPPPTRNKDSQRQAALAHLDRMRAASQAVLAFLAIPNKESTSLPQDVLLKCHTSAMQTLDFIAEVMPKLVDIKKEEKDKPVTLQDAWTKVLEFPTQDVSTTASLLEGPATPKRLKTNDDDTRRSPVIRSRVLLTPGRKTPSNLLPELERKGAKLVRPPPKGEGSHLIVEFGDAFVMTIYLVPLLVTIRASTSVDNIFTAFTDDECASWTPVQAGLEERPELNIWGVTGTPATLGHVVQGQLNFASAHATAVLRKYFGNTSNAKHDFEVEISEGTALLQFLQLARNTYAPNFQDLTDE